MIEEKVPRFMHCKNGCIAKDSRGEFIRATDYETLLMQYYKIKNSFNLKDLSYCIVKLEGLINKKKIKPLICQA